ncbi:hypothetical protein KI387_029183 [Taxus chinensis]|uniref:Uncharacterized protein n=1 Tax=Taxus chinensis TaxID=29808 RepID=A0AA38C9F8_TAXCH|nr:hypothetical protein KI387_029183 [Taxus chinensis]
MILSEKMRETIEDFFDCQLKLFIEFTGLISCMLVSLINRAGGNVVGLCRKDGKLITIRPAGGYLGFVGEVSHINISVLKAIVDNGSILVIASVAADDSGEAFHVEEDEVATVENILRMAGIEDGDVQWCLKEIRNNVSDNEDAQKTKEVHVELECFGMPKDLNQPQTINEEVDHLSSTTHVSQTQEVLDVDDSLNSMPTQLNPPQWVKEGAIKLNMQIDFNNEEVSLSMPSPPPPIPSEAVRDYADTLEGEAHDAF